MCLVYRMRQNAHTSRFYYRHGLPLLVDAAWRDSTRAKLSPQIGTSHRRLQHAGRAASLADLGRCWKKMCSCSSDSWALQVQQGDAPRQNAMVLVNKVNIIVSVCTSGGKVICLTCAFASFIHFVNMVTTTFWFDCNCELTLQLSTHSEECLQWCDSTPSTLCAHWLEVIPVHFHSLCRSRQDPWT